MPRAERADLKTPWYARLLPFRSLNQDRHLNQLLTLMGATCLMLVVAAASAVLLLDNRAAGDEVLKLQRVTTDVARLMIYLQRAETSQRGYLLTTNSDYLDLYKDSISKIDPVLEAITEGTKGRQAQADELLNLRTVIAAKLAEMAKAIQLESTGQHAEAIELVRSNQGKILMEQIRASVASIWTDTTQSNESRIAGWRSNGDWLFAVQLTAVVLIILVSTLAVISGLRHTRGLQETQEALEQANQRLEDRVRARTADLQEANDEVQKFAYIISHDLRSPLVNIMGFTAELATIRTEVATINGLTPTTVGDAPRSPAQIDAEFGEALGFIRQSTTKMDRLISAVLKLARSGQRQFHDEPLDMNALVADIAATLKHRTAEIGAQIVIQDLPALTSDRLAVDQIFGNLLDNAVKYLDESRLGRIEVRGRALPRAVLFEIEDNGRGIANEDVGRIFDLFRRGGKQDKPGEGIGLAHLRALVRRLGGKITCRSELGTGSVFAVLLPQGDTSSGDKVA